MTVYERLFGTPERAARTLGEIDDPVEACHLANGLGKGPYPCGLCLFDHIPFDGCDRRDMTVLEWLESEVGE